MVSDVVPNKCIVTVLGGMAYIFWVLLHKMQLNGEFRRGFLLMQDNLPPFWVQLIKLAMPQRVSCLLEKKNEKRRVEKKKIGNFADKACACPSGKW